MNRTLRILIVERHVAARYRRFQRRACVAHAGDCLTQLKIDIRLFGVAEIEIVGDRHRPRTGARHVSCCFRYRRTTTVPGRQRHVASVAVDTKCDGFVGSAERDDGGVTSGSAHGAGAHRGVVLLPNPLLTGNGRR